MGNGDNALMFLKMTWSLFSTSHWTNETKRAADVGGKSGCSLPTADMKSTPFLGGRKDREHCKPGCFAKQYDLNAKISTKIIPICCVYCLCSSPIYITAKPSK